MDHKKRALTVNTCYASRQNFVQHHMVNKGCLRQPADPNYLPPLFSGARPPPESAADNFAGSALSSLLAISLLTRLKHQKSLTMTPLKPAAIALLVLSLAAPAIRAQIPWDIDIIPAEAIGREPGFSYGFSPVNSPNYYQLGRTVAQQADGKYPNLYKMLEYKAMKVKNLIVPRINFRPSTWKHWP